MDITYFSSPVGTLEICGSEKGIRSVLYSDKFSNSNPIPECLKTCVDQLNEYFDGTRKVFDLVLDPVCTDFQLLVWQKLLEIPFGKTISYLDLAMMTGSKMNTRAVGNANGRNKINIIVPCHRVIGSNGQLTGYGGGLWRKQFLLRHEAKDLFEGLFGNANG